MVHRDCPGGSRIPAGPGNPALPLGLSLWQPHSGCEAAEVSNETWLGTWGKARKSITIYHNAVRRQQNAWYSITNSAFCWERCELFCSIPWHWCSSLNKAGRLIKGYKLWGYANKEQRSIMFVRFPIPAPKRSCTASPSQDEPGFLLAWCCSCSIWKLFLFLQRRGTCYVQMCPITKLSSPTENAAVLTRAAESTQ